MTKPQRNEYVQEVLEAAWEKTQQIGELAEDRSSDIREILRLLSHVVYRVGEAIVDQVAASSASAPTSTDD